MLFEHEKEALLAALRRDLHRELAMLGPEADDHPLHYFNVRMALRLLDIFQPR